MEAYKLTPLETAHVRCEQLNRLASLGGPRSVELHAAAAQAEAEYIVMRDKGEHHPGHKKGFNSALAGKA